METIKVIDFSEFKRGMLGLLKILMFEAMESQRLDHYAMYKTMLDIVDEWVSTADSTTAESGDLSEGLEELLQEDDEAIARMILNFPKDQPDYA